MNKNKKIKKYISYVNELFISDPLLFKKLDSKVIEERRRYVNGEDTSDLGIKRITKNE